LRGPTSKAGKGKGGVGEGEGKEGRGEGRGGKGGPYGNGPSGPFVLNPPLVVQ